MDLWKAPEEYQLVLFVLLPYLLTTSVFRQISMEGRRKTTCEALGGSASAVSDGKIYCFIDTVRELTDSYEQASIVHVGAGSIQVGYRLHYTVFDSPSDNTNSTRGYNAQYAAIPDDASIQSEFARDTTSPDLRITCVVHDSLYLACWYHLSPQQSSQQGEISISPGSFLRRLLTDATLFGIRLRLDDVETDFDSWDGLDEDYGSGDLSDMDLIYSDSDEDAPNDHLEYRISAHGEGSLPPRSSGDTAIIIRPHYGNKLGRCAALTTSIPPVALVNDIRDLRKFVIASLQPEALLGDQKRPWTLIS